MDEEVHFTAGFETFKKTSSRDKTELEEIDASENVNQLKYATVMNRSEKD